MRTVNTRTVMYIDISDAQSMIHKLRDVHSEAEMKLILTRSLKRAGESVRTIVKRELPKDYQVKQGYVYRHIGNASIRHGGFGSAMVTAEIPLTGSRGTIGKGASAVYKLFDYRQPRPLKPLKNGKRRRRPRKQVTLRAKLVTGEISTLPEKIVNQGGNPPFVWKNLVFTRRTKKRLPIVRVVGLNVPRMPLNRSESRVQAGVMEVLYKRLEHEHERMIQKVK